MSASISPLDTCELILSHVRSSCLNFAIQETPFSVYLTLRKSFSQVQRRYPTSDNSPSLIASSLGPNNLETELKMLKEDFKLLQFQSDQLKKSKDDLSNKIEEEVILSENLKSELIGEREKLQFMHEKFEKLESKVTILKSEKKKLDEKHLKTCAEVKHLKSQKEELDKENNKINIAIKTVKKETKESHHKYEKVIKQLEENIQELVAYKATKTSEEKTLRKKKKRQEKLERADKNKSDMKPSIPDLKKSSPDVLDLNENKLEALCHNDKADIIIKARVPTDNFYECLEDLEAKPIEVEEPPDYESVQILLDIAELKIRTKVKYLIKRKLEAKHEEMEISEDDSKALEEALIVDMEEIVQEELRAYRTTLEIGEDDEGSIDPYGPPEGCSAFYWSGENSCEINCCD